MSKPYIIQTWNLGTATRGQDIFNGAYYLFRYGLLLGSVLQSALMTFSIICAARSSFGLPRQWTCNLQQAFAYLSMSRNCGRQAKSHIPNCDILVKYNDVGFKVDDATPYWERLSTDKIMV